MVIIGLYGVVFHGEDACDVQRCVTLQNNMKNLKKLQEILTKFRTCFFSGVEKLNVRNRLKRVLPKFEACASYFRGVNGRSKFVVVLPNGRQTNGPPPYRGPKTVEQETVY